MKELNSIYLSACLSKTCSGQKLNRPQEIDKILLFAHLKTLSTRASTPSTNTTNAPSSNAKYFNDSISSTQASTQELT
jgi:hypothetical protein